MEDYDDESKGWYEDMHDDDPTFSIISDQLFCFLGTITSSTSSTTIQSYLCKDLIKVHDNAFEGLRRKMPNPMDVAMWCCCNV